MIIPFDKSKYDYSTEEILENITGSRLLSAEIEFNRSCNYLCPYCYAAGNSDHAQLDPAVATDAIRQVHALGAKKIVVLGGEPLLCKQLKANIELITGELGMGAEIFTNGALINEDWAKFFFEHGCRVVVKLNSLRPEVQERLTGVPNALDKAFHAIRVLKDAGFDSEMLVASSVISAENEQEVAELWKYLRRNAIKPYLEIMTPQGRLLENRDLEVHPRRLKEIFDEIAAFDNANGYDWEPQPPLGLRLGTPAAAGRLKMPASSVFLRDRSHRKCHPVCGSDGSIGQYLRTETFRYSRHQCGIAETQRFPQHHQRSLQNL